MVGHSSAAHAPRPCASDVVMIELITGAHTIDSANGLMDVKPLLMLMDICTCASAEKHTGVNCVTVSMGDVVFEYYPKCGEMLELTARPVFCGRTSLDISLSVVAEAGSVRRRVCDAIFTYVTTRGPQGEKRLCPELSDSSLAGGASSEQNDWERTLAQHRRSLLTVEQKRSSCVLNTLADTLAAAKDEQSLSGFDLEISEVVLPAHQNHMGNTFGGVVMAWMAKAALALAARKSRRSPGSLLVRSVLRVSFQCGSAVSDHLIFRPRLNAIFDEGRSAEVEVRVSKKSITTGVEIGMNVGYFYVSGSAVGTGTDIPFDFPNGRFRSSSSSEEEVLQKKTQGDAAEWRRRLLLARRQLLEGFGDPVEWHPSLHGLAPLLTIKSVLRLARHNDHSVYWRELPTTSQTNNIVTSVEWTPGESWGRSDTFVLRVKGVLSFPLKSDPAQSLIAVIQTLKTKRPQWDMFCNGIAILESCEQAEGDGAGLSNAAPTQKGIQWDVVQHLARTPSIFVKACEETGTRPERVIPFCYLRTWKVDPAEGTAILAAQSVLHAKAKTTPSMARVKPSGWFISCTADGAVELTYMVEHDLVSMRELALGMSDESIVETMAGLAKQWFVGLTSFFEHEGASDDGR
jgi:acyl-CoA hydrolase